VKSKNKTVDLSLNKTLKSVIAAILLFMPYPMI